MNWKYDISVITPTYNRGAFLPIIYDSLIKQSLKNFEWIVVDDGSSDDTKEIMAGFIADGLIDIKYVYKENGGKHTALNRAATIAEGELFFIVDSDDWLLPEALDKVVSTWISVSDMDKKSLCGVVALRGYDAENAIGGFLPEMQITMNYWERYDRKIFGDKAEVFRTDIIRNFPFPEFAGEGFVTEALVWNRIATAGYTMCFINHIVYICNYLEGGLTSNYTKLMGENWGATCLYFNEFFSSPLGIYTKIRQGLISFVIYGNDANKTFVEMANCLDNRVFRILTVLVGPVLFSLWKLKNCN